MTANAVQFPAVPKDWGVFLVHRARLARLCWVPTSSAPDLARFWQAQAQKRHTEVIPWDRRHYPAYMRAWPPSLTLDYSEYDDLGYPRFMEIANFYKTWKMGGIS